MSEKTRAGLLAWLGTLHFLWEDRYSEQNPPPEGDRHRRLLRPVYWLGNWQFACLDYYHPPAGIADRCVLAEPFPPVLASLTVEIERITRSLFRAPDLPPRWHLNTCLINLYGTDPAAEGRKDKARVGEHKDFEPGPVGSISLGERALFQFVTGRSGARNEAVAWQRWLDDRSLLIFGGDRWKRRLFHRVQRVERSLAVRFDVGPADFETRRINFTLRYVPAEHVVPFGRLGPKARESVRRYVEELARFSPHFAAELAKDPAAGPRDHGA